MIQVVNEFPWEGEYTPPALLSLIGHGNDTLHYTRELYEVRDQSGQIILTAGVAIWSMVRVPEIWILLTKAFTINLRNALLLTREALHLPASRFPGLVCEVEKTNRQELNFVRKLGLAPTNCRSIRPDGQNYIQFGIS